MGMDDTYGPEPAATKEGLALGERKTALEAEIAETKKALAKNTEGKTVEPGEKTEVDSPGEQVYNKEKARLPEEQWTKLQKETGWPAEILNYISSLEKAAIYQRENLKPQKVGDRWALTREIDMDYADPVSGKTNRQLIAKGYSPKDPITGETIVLHHLGQEFDAPFVELPSSLRRGKEPDATS